MDRFELTMKNVIIFATLLLISDVICSPAGREITSFSHVTPCYNCNYPYTCLYNQCVLTFAGEIRGRYDRDASSTFTTFDFQGARNMNNTHFGYEYCFCTGSSIPDRNDRNYYPVFSYHNSPDNCVLRYATAGRLRIPEISYVDQEASSRCARRVKKSIPSHWDTYEDTPNYDGTITRNYYVYQECRKGSVCGWGKVLVWVASEIITSIATGFITDAISND
jgi:hypothetical protein